MLLQSRRGHVIRYTQCMPDEYATGHVHECCSLGLSCSTTNSECTTKCIFASYFQPKFSELVRQCEVSEELSLKTSKAQRHCTGVAARSLYPTKLSVQQTDEGSFFRESNLTKKSAKNLQNASLLFNFFEIFTSFLASLGHPAPPSGHIA